MVNEKDRCAVPLQCVGDRSIGAEVLSLMVITERSTVNAKWEVVGSTMNSERLFAEQIRSAVMDLAQRLRMERSDRTLGTTQISILSRLFNNGPMSQKQIADAERIMPSAVARLCVTLERRDLISRERDKEDGRRFVVSITNGGRDIIMADRGLRVDTLLVSLSKLTLKEKERLSSLLGLLVKITSE